MNKENPRSLKSDTELREIVRQHNIDPDKTLIIYCGTGREGLADLTIGNLRSAQGARQPCEQPPAVRASRRTGKRDGQRWMASHLIPHLRPPLGVGIENGDWQPLRDATR